MAHQSKALTEAWRSPLLTDRMGLRHQHESGRLQGGFIDGRFQHDGWKPAHQKRSDGFSAYGGGGNQRVGPGWDDAPNRFDGIGAVDVWIDGTRWIERDDEWQPEEAAPRKRAND